MTDEQWTRSAREFVEQQRKLRSSQRAEQIMDRYLIKSKHRSRRTDGKQRGKK